MPEIRLRWMDNFEVGIEELDADHRRMFRQINKICEAGTAGDIALVATQLAELVDLAAAHIERETRVQAALDRGNAFAADTASSDRLKPISDLVARFARGDRDVARVPGELVDWFCRQTIDHDAAIRARFHRSSSPTCLRWPAGRTSAVTACEAEGSSGDRAHRPWTEPETAALPD